MQLQSLLGYKNSPNCRVDRVIKVSDKIRETFIQMILQIARWPLHRTFTSPRFPPRHSPILRRCLHNRVRACNNAMRVNSAVPERRDANSVTSIQFQIAS